MDTTTPSRWAQRPSDATSTTARPSFDTPAGKKAHTRPDRRRKRLLLWLVGLAIIIAASVVLGVGLGLGLSKDKSSSSCGAHASSTMPQNCGSPIASTSYYQTTGSIPFPSSVVSIPSFSTYSYYSPSYYSPSYYSPTSSVSPTSSYSITTTSSYSVTSTSSYSVTSTSTSTSSPSPSPSGVPQNIVRISGTPQFVGNVTSINTPDDVRDLGYQGQIGGVWINTFGDTIPCQEAWPTQHGCFGIDASNSAAIPQNITRFLTINTVKNRTQPFCPRIGSEPPGFGLGLTNVVETSNDTGIVYVLAINRDKTHKSPAGSGIGIVTLDANGTPSCARPTSHFWHINSEPHYGDHSAVLDADGYIYAYGGGRASDCPPAPQHCLNYLWLARVPQANASELAAYEYWNGTAYTPHRLINPSIKSSVMYGGQGTVIWSPFYNMYMSFKPDCIGGCIVVSVAYRPEGPWSDTKVILASNERPYKRLTLYTPVVQAKFSAPDLSWMIIMFTGTEPGAGNILQSINVTFTK